jgi:hypothetical protein
VRSTTLAQAPSGGTAHKSADGQSHAHSSV